MTQKAKDNKLTKVVTGKVRLSYVHVFQPQSTDFGEKYSVTVLIPKSDTVTLKKIQAAISEAVKLGPAAWGGPIAKPWMPIHDGDGEKPNGGPYGDECKGCYVMTCSSTTKPGVVDAALNPITDSTEIYSGCYAKVSINFYPNKKGKKGIAAGLNNIQKIADGDYLGGRSRAEDDFEIESDLGGDTAGAGIDLLNG